MAASRKMWLAHPASLPNTVPSFMASRAPWSSQLEQLTLVVTTLAPFARWSALRPAHAWLAVVLADDDRQPSGWQLRFGPGDAVEISQVGWHPQATMAHLATIIHRAQEPDIGCYRGYQLRNPPHDSFVRAERPANFLRSVPSRRPR